MTDFVMKLTAIGAAKIAAASSGGPAVVLTTMAVGDGNGNPVAAPTGNETALVREVYRSQLNSLAVNANDHTLMLAEISIPSNVGNFAIYEIGVFDASGALFAYGNFPATWKPIAANGSTRDMTVQAAMKVGNSAVVNLVIDTSIVAATRQWVLATITRAFLIPGGTVGQVLAKASNADGDFKFVDPTAAVNVLVNVVKELQTTVNAQTVYTLATMTTDGVAIYVAGTRIFDFTVLSKTQVQLGTARAAGQQIAFVQNEPNEPLQLRRLAISRAFYMGQF